MRIGKFEQQIIRTGRRLAQQSLLVANAGNISGRLNKETLLITATGAPLGSLRRRDLVCVDISTGLARTREAKPSSELSLHRMVYRSFPVRFVVHCHPPLANAYFSVHDSLKILTMETEHYLGKVPLVRQGTVTVTRPIMLIQAFKRSDLVAVKNHGVFGIGDDPAAIVDRIEILEEAVKVAAVARLFCKKDKDFLDLQLAKHLA